VCVGQVDLVAFDPGSGTAAMTHSVGMPVIALDAAGRCEGRYTGRFVGVRWQRLVDNAHFLSARIVGFARGLNDTPEIAALLLVLRAIDIRWGLLAVAVAMAAATYGLGNT